MTRSSHSSHSILRQAIRGILKEEAGPGKSLSLVSKLQAINAELRAAGIPAKVGIFFESGQAREYAFALKNEPMLSGLYARPINLASFGGWGPADVVAAVKRTFHRKIEDEGIADAAFDAAMSTPEAQAAMAQIPWGSISFSGAKQGQDGGDCSGAQIVRLTTDTARGWGPLLYDLAMEYASTGRGGLAPDRESVSTAARGVWSKYDTARGDVQKVQLDVPYKFAQREPEMWGDNLTATYDDDCGMDAAQAGMPEPGGWRDSPLSRSYRKPDGSTTAALKAAGLLWR
jgi:hypothetical protein